MKKEKYQEGFTITIDIGDAIVSINNKNEYGLGVMMDVFEKALIAYGFDAKSIEESFIYKAERINKPYKQKRN